MEIYMIGNDKLLNVDFEHLKTDETQKYWLILTPDELKEKISYFNFSSQTLYDCMYNDDTPKIDIYENYSFGIINDIDEGKDHSVIYELNFYLSNRYLIFVSKKHLSIFNEIKNEICNKGTLLLSPDKILYILFDKLTSKDNRELSELETEIAEVESDVIEGKDKDYINNIVSLKKRLLTLKTHYEPLIDIIEDLTENENNVLEEKSIAYFIILFNRIERLNRKVGNLRDYVTQIRESYQSQLDINTNNIMKLFTVIAAIFLPLTLITSWYGMNFQYMPELNWRYGYIFAIALSIVIVIISLLIFKKKKWM